MLQVMRRDYSRAWVDAGVAVRLGVWLASRPADLGARRRSPLSLNYDQGDAETSLASMRASCICDRKPVGLIGAAKVAFLPPSSCRLSAKIAAGAHLSAMCPAVGPSASPHALQGPPEDAIGTPTTRQYHQCRKELASAGAARLKVIHPHGSERDSPA